MSTAASYLSAVSKADARARKHGATPASTPALSMSSSITSSSQDTVLDENNLDFTDGLSYPRVPPSSDQVFATVHSEFGHCANEQYRYTSQHPKGTPYKSIPEQEPPYYILLTTYISYILVICLGHLRDFVGKRFRAAQYRHLLPWKGYAALNSDFDSFYTRRLKLRIDDCFSHPTTGVPGRTIVLLDRYSSDYNKTMVPTGTRTRALNVSSYNYLGFAQSSGPCTDAVETSIEKYGVAAGGTRLEGGTLDLHVQTEALIARFLGMEDALVSSMGFATNSTIIPALVSKGCLVISDELNHASIRFGVRLSGANVRMFKHNDMKALEDLLREVISQGQPKTHRPWKKILLIVEGLYSMEGTMANLPVIMELKKKYKFYLFVDEAHSVGAIGPHGRGVTDYFGIDPRSVDILMGTFTKSFGAAGGYIAGSKAVVDRLRIQGHSGAYAEAMTPPVLTQIVASMASIMGVTLPAEKPSSPSLALLRSSDFSPAISESDLIPGTAPATALPSWMPLAPTMVDGSDGLMRLRRIAFNARYLNRGLRKLGFITYGMDDSPVVPLLIFHPGKMAVFSRLMRTYSTPIVVVVVGYPATPLVTSRVRFCLSSAHTKEDIDTVLRACDEIGDVLDLKQASGERWPVEEIISRALELVQMPEMP
ncbi:serine palmitoyltransferase 2 [Trametes versicolor FP-101664 SS1]|uniref:serine palmitoyltransferase 2 n=1 Tax=Trametes versicolor (strain FP-101664) TaxID=717944 RepID=UPI0004621951|nr:serine palmitoyltransferase 2 [Trametes versicolor FP-101664 SS1]EIW53578.1 serine palmitoyltransferase 2 [Trametes versicolor FP-101664 SS1]